MTNEEAIEYLKKADVTVYQEPKTKTAEALEMAIKSLEQEPCEDAISRQSVLEIFGYVMSYWKEHAIDVEPHEIEDAIIEQYEFTAKELIELPSVTPKPKTDVLGKIRAEIENKIVKRPRLDFKDMERDRNDAFLEVLDIIDKYKVESEDKE